MISVLANVVPREVADMCNAFKTGDLQTAQQIHHQTMQLALDLFIDTNPIPVKTALQIMGKLNGRMRLPLAPMSDDTLEVLRQTMENTGLL